MIDNYIIEHPSYQYALSVVNNEIISGKYIKKNVNVF
ncbi:terminase large subunit [Staphylococcus phage S-CoN_Ph4]|nr:terminase large subunit [Staphylococcus phage S-CoN_Ph4]WNM55895.1 terminase large subunit [Staphylococcus phage S-CoN_Ph38]